MEFETVDSARGELPEDYQLHVWDVDEGDWAEDY